MLKAFVWRYQLSFFHTCQARFATGGQIWPNKFLTFKFQLFLGKRFQKAPVLLVDVRWRNKRLRGNWRWRRRGTLKRSFLNVFHKAKAKTLAYESQQTWTNQFRSSDWEKTLLMADNSLPAFPESCKVVTCVYMQGRGLNSFPLKTKQNRNIGPALSLLFFRFWFEYFGFRARKLTGTFEKRVLVI